MANPTVDTFEHDIANEIRNKEASITDIASAVGDIGNTETETPKNGLVLMGSVIILILCGLVGAGYAGYLYYNEDMTTKKVTPSVTTTSEQKKDQAGAQLQAISPSINQSIGVFLNNVQKTNLGYSITILSYSPVFAYMIKNENEFGDEIALAVGNKHVRQDTMIPVTPINTGTSTPQSSTSTQVTTSTTSGTTSLPSSELTTTYTFTDITISNQNMRVAKSVYGTVVYAFIGNQRLVISSSTEGILALRSNILHK